MSKNFMYQLNSGQPWYMPGIWPLGNVAASISKKNDEKAPTPTAISLMGPFDIGTAIIAGNRFEIYEPTIKSLIISS